VAHAVQSAFPVPLLYLPAVQIAQLLLLTTPGLRRPYPASHTLQADEAVDPVPEVEDPALQGVHAELEAAIL
jgi:hypothetical protein